MRASQMMGRFAYDFVRKRLSVVVQHEDSSRLLITKGALENVLAVCSRVQTPGGESDLGEAEQAEVQKRFEVWSEQGYRVLGVAIKRVHAQDHPYSTRDEASMAFVGFLLFMDPPKPGVQDTIAALEKLGVQLKIITGDNHLVARHIGNILGLKDLKVMSSRELDALRDEALWHAVEQTTIFSEVDPNEKERIILALKKQYCGQSPGQRRLVHTASSFTMLSNCDMLQGEKVGQLP